MAKATIPQSVPAHLLESNRTLWSVLELIDWTAFSEQNVIISGSAFIDIENPFGKKGNPFTVLVGPGIQELSAEARLALAHQTGTPETIFVNSLNEAITQPEDGKVYELNLTVNTPTGKELGACAHGFTGALQTLLELGRISVPSVVEITTTLGTAARASISEQKVISLEFKVQTSHEVLVDGDIINTIFNVEVFSDQLELLVLSVGSPKLTVEVTPEEFDQIQKNLGSLNYQDLLTLQEKLKVNGIHVFCRNSQNCLPEKVIQVNAFLGKDNVIDPATGVSCAAQVGEDKSVEENEVVKLTQYTAAGPSADLFVTKGSDGVVYVGGTAVLFNFEKIDV